MSFLGSFPERGSADIPVSFAKAGVSVVPTSITYSVSDADGTIINAVSNVSVVTPATAITITLSGTDLSVLDTYNIDRVLTVKAIYGGSSTPQNAEATFTIDRLVNVP